MTTAAAGPTLRWKNNPYDASACAAMLPVPGRCTKAIAVSSSGETLVVGLEDGRLLMWDLASRAQRELGHAHARRVHACAFTPDGRTLVSASADGTMRIWDVREGRLIAACKEHRGEVTSCAVFPDGRRAISGATDGALRIWDLSDGTLIESLRGHRAGVSACALSADGRRIASTAWTDTYIRDADTGGAPVVFGGHANAVTACALSPDGSRVATASVDRTIRLSDASTGATIAVLAHRGPVSDCAFSRDGAYVFSTSVDQAVRVWDAHTGEERFVLAAHREPVIGCAVASGEYAFVTASRREIRVWRFPAASEFRKQPWGKVHAISPDGSLVATTAAESVHLWDAETADDRGALDGHRVWVPAIAFSPDSRWLVSASIDESLKIWNIEQCTDVATLVGHSGKLSNVAVSPDGSRVLSVADDIRGSRDRGPKLWDPATGTIVTSLNGFKFGEWPSAFSPDGSRVLCAVGNDVRIIDAASGRVIASVPHDETPYDYAYSPDGMQIATTAGKTVRLLSPTGGDVRLLTGHAELVTACRFFPDGSHLVSSSTDGALLIWNVADGRAVAEVRAGGQYPQWVVTENASRLIVRVDGRLAIWDISEARQPRRIATLDEVGEWAVAPDGSWVVTLGENDVALIDTLRAEVAARHPVEGRPETLAWSPTARMVAIGCSSRAFYLLGLENAPATPRVAFQWRSPVDRAMRVHCPSCRSWFDAGPGAAGQTRPCPKCAATLQISPVIVEADWRRVDAAVRQPVVIPWRQADRGADAEFGCPLCQTRMRGAVSGGDGVTCPGCGAQLRITDGSAIGRPAPRLGDADAAMREQKDKAFRELLGMVKLGDLDRIDALFGAKPEGASQSGASGDTTLLDIIESERRAARSPAPSGPARTAAPIPKRPWWKFW